MKTAETSNQAFKSPKPSPRPKHTAKSRPVYVPRKPSAAAASESKLQPDSAIVPAPEQTVSNSVATTDALRANLETMRRSYAELQGRFDSADEEFKSALFARSKLERERQNLARDLKTKMKTVERLDEESAQHKRQLREVEEKVAACENRISRLQVDNTQLLQAILEKDRTIGEMGAKSKSPQPVKPNLAKADKGVNTVPTAAMRSETRKATMDKKLAEAENEDPYERTSDEIERKERLIAESKQKEETLLAEKAAIEKEFADLKEVIKSFGSFDGILPVRLMLTLIDKRRRELRGRQLPSA